MKKLKTFLILCSVISCTNTSSNETQLSNENDLLAYGKGIYENQCVACHGKKGNGQFSGSKDLTKTSLNETEIGDLVYHGRKNMPAFKDRLGEPEIQAVSKFVLTLKENK